MPPTQRSRRQRQRTAGVLLAVTAAALTLSAVPQRPPTPAEARADRHAHASRLARQELAGAIDRYRLEHGALPGRVVAGDLAAPPSARLLARQLTGASDLRGDVVPAPEPAFPFGPYLPAGLPENPDNGRSQVRFAPADAPPDGSTGWIVDPATGEVRSNALPAEVKP